MYLASLVRISNRTLPLPFSSWAIFRCYRPDPPDKEDLPLCIQTHYRRQDYTAGSDTQEKSPSNMMVDCEHYWEKAEQFQS